MNAVLSKRIQEGYLQDVTPYYYYYTYWALTQGALELCHPRAFNRVDEDVQGLMRFIMDVGVNMGNRKTG